MCSSARFSYSLVRERGKSEFLLKKIAIFNCSYSCMIMNGESYMCTHDISMVDSTKVPHEYNVTRLRKAFLLPKGGKEIHLKFLKMDNLLKG